jgi:hypothetical protein
VRPRGYGAKAGLLRLPPVLGASMRYCFGLGLPARFLEYVRQSGGDGPLTFRGFLCERDAAREVLFGGGEVSSLIRPERGVILAFPGVQMAFEPRQARIWRSRKAVSCFACLITSRRPAIDRRLLFATDPA